MIRQNEIEKLIIKGFDLELIAFELDLPMEYVIECNRNIELRTKLSKNYSEKMEQIRNDAHLRMEKMRERYMELVSTIEQTDVAPKRFSPEPNSQLIETTIATIEETLNSMKELPKKERRKKAREILNSLKEIKEEPLTIEQAEKLKVFLEAEALKNIRIDEVDRIEYYIDAEKTKVAIKLARAVEIAAEQTKDIPELKSLAQRITYEMAKRNQLAIGIVKSKIERKVAELEHNKIIDSLRNDISQKVESIIIALAQGTLDIEQAKTIIKEEAQERVKNKPKSRFALTAEQEEKQILIQIKTALREKVDKYHIENPVITIEQLTRTYQWRARTSN